MDSGQQFSSAEPATDRSQDGVRGTQAGMSTSISSRAFSAREQSRQSDGTFGQQRFARADGIDLDPAPSGVDTLRGALENGYSPELLENVNRDLDGFALLAVWEKHDAFGPHGHSQLYVRRHADATVREVPGELFEHLTDPASGIDLYEVDLFSGEPLPAADLVTCGSYAYAFRDPGPHRAEGRQEEGPAPFVHARMEADALMGRIGDRPADERSDALAAAEFRLRMAYERVVVASNEAEIERLSDEAAHLTPPTVVAISIEEAPSGEDERWSDMLRAVVPVDARGEEVSIEEQDRGVLEEWWQDGVDRDYLDVSTGSALTPSETSGMRYLHLGSAFVIPVKGREHGLNEPFSWA